MASLWSYIQGGLVAILLDLDLTLSERADLLRVYLDPFGVLAPLVYMLIVTIEVVVAPIPGTLLYLPGGVIFGWIVGGSMALLGNTLGAGLSYCLMKHVGRPFLERHVNLAAVERHKRAIRHGGPWVIAFLRVNPLTSSDLISYAAALTPMSVWNVMVGTFAGMAPLCYIQSYAAEEVFRWDPRLFYLVLAVAAVYFALAVWLILVAGRKVPPCIG